MTDPSALDASTRRRLVADLGSTLFVEAGAGTGKTTAITRRIVELVAAGLVAAERLVAITFTEAAAAELRARVREALEAAAVDPGRSEAARERCRLAAGEIDRASIDTIHAFAGELLRTYPLEAGLPPEFQVLDDIEQDLRFEERLRAWFEAVSEHPEHRGAVRRCLLLDLTPDRIRDLAAALQEQRDLVSARTRWPATAPPEPVEVARRLGRDLEELISLVDAHAPDGHPLVTVAERLRFPAERLRSAGTDVEALRALSTVESISGRGAGTQDGWAAECRQVKNGLGEAESEAGAVLTAHRRAAFCGLAEALRDFVLADAAGRARDGVATFHDLLTWARDLLRDDREVRARAQRRWSRVFVDEFQDTDPLQAELAFYLSAVPDAEASDWQDLLVEPGKLCLVGDPKQSIYRFRRADIAAYEQLRRRAGETIPLARNFRSGPGIVAWVNHHFGSTMVPGAGVQPAYQPLVAHVRDGPSPSVWTVGGPVADRQPEVWRLEAEAVAECARRAVDEGWPVSGSGGSERTARPARWRDVCVLMPARTNLRRLERALERWSVPYRVESGELVVVTQEVRDLVSCLRAIDDPSDQVALVAALRSPIYGCSDPELLRWVEGGGRLGFEQPGGGGAGRVAEALAGLRRFHELRYDLSVPALAERLVDDRMLVAAAFGEPRPREAWRRWRYVVARARAFAATGRATLREFVEWMEGLEREQARAVAGAVVESDEDAVRVLTVHGAKGLEFPIVILTGLGSRPSFIAPAVIADRETGSLELGTKAGGTLVFSTPGYEAAKSREQSAAEAESLRLLYVAATRARDHLVMSLFRRDDAQGATTHAARVAAGLETFTGAVGRIDLAGEPPAGEQPAPPAGGHGRDEMPAESPDEDRRAEREWLERRQAAVRAGSGPRLATATGLAGEAERAGGEAPEPAPDVAALRRGRGATAVGRAVHAVLQAIDLDSLSGLEHLAAARAAAEGIPREAGRVADLVRRTASSLPVRRAVAARHWREVPVGGMVGGTLLEGFIDLLYETDGGLAIVDYKTDDVSPAEVAGRLDRYRLQGGAYALLAEAATGRRVASVEFVFAQPGIVRAVDDVAGAVEAARQAAEAVV